MVRGRGACDAGDAFESSPAFRDPAGPQHLGFDKLAGETPRFSGIRPGPGHVDPAGPRACGSGRAPGSSAAVGRGAVPARTPLKGICCGAVSGKDGLSRLA